MPELPEVEVVRRQLEAHWVGARVTGVWASQASSFFVTSPSVLRRKLLGQKALRLERRGKYILACFEDSGQLLCHLGMTGQISARQLPPDPHLHLILTLDNGSRITFRDVRRFGKVEYIEPGRKSPRLEKLGPDALGIPTETFVERLRARRVALKTALLNQAVLAGVGNIYADEALFAARLLPTQSAARVSKPKLRRLHAELQRILQSSIAGGGSTINDYLKPDGQLGGYQHWHQVYGKRGEPCPACGQPLRHRVLGGRSTHYCSSCQH